MWLSAGRQLADDLLVFEIRRQLQRLVERDERSAHVEGGSLVTSRRPRCIAAADRLINGLLECQATLAHELSHDGVRVRLKCHSRAHACIIASPSMMQSHQRASYPSGA